MDVLIGVIPSVGVAFLFYLAVKAMINADRRERQAQAELDHRDREQVQMDRGDREPVD